MMEAPCDWAIRGGGGLIESQETRRRESIRAGGERLDELLKARGFSSYGDFMWAALRTEMATREETLRSLDLGQPGSEVRAAEGAAPNLPAERRPLALFHQHCSGIDADLRQAFASIDQLVLLSEKLLPKSQFVLRLAGSIQLLSLNASIAASRLSEESGRTLAAVAERIGQHTEKNTSLLTEMNRGITALTTPLGQLLFNIVTSKLQIEMLARFAEELPTDRQEEGAGQGASIPPLLAPQVELLLHAFNERIGQTLPSIQRLQAELAKIKGMTDRLRSFVRTLHFIQLLGQVESSRTAEGAAFRSIFEGVMKEADEADKEVKEFAAIIDSTLGLMKNMRQTERAISASTSLLTREFSQIQGLDIALPQATADPVPPAGAV